MTFSGTGEIREKLYRSYGVSTCMSRKFIALVTLLLATSVFAEDRLSVFSTSKGAGIGMAHDWNSHWATELSIAAERSAPASSR